MTFEKIEIDQTYYDVHTYRMGNTTIRTVGVWPIRVISKDATYKTVVASWNNNAPQTFYGMAYRKWKAQRPI